MVLVVFSVLFAEEPVEYLHYRLGMKYKTEKQYDRAIDEFRKVIAEYPDNYNVYMHIAEIRVLQAQPRQAIANLKQSLAYNPGWGKAHRMLAEAYLADGQPQQAIGEYQELQQTCEPSERDSIQQVLDRLVASVGSGQTVALQPADQRPARSAGVPAPTIGAAQPIKTVSVLPADSGAAELFKRALASYDERRYDSALAQLRRVIALQPGFRGAYYFAGIIRSHRGEYEFAKINFARAQDFTEPAYTGLFCLGKICGEEKKYAEAVRLLSRYLALTCSEPGKKEAQPLLARYRALRDRPAAPKDTAEVPAVPNLPKVNSVEPLILEVRIDSLLAMVTVDTFSEAGQKLLKGIREFQAGRYDKAVLEFKKTSAAYPTGVVAAQSSYNCGICYFKLRLFREAANQFQLVIDRFPRDPLAGQSCFLQALIHTEQGDHTKAEERFREFIQGWPRHPWEGKAWEKLGDAYAALEQFKKSVDAYTRAVTVTNACPDQVIAFFKMGNAFSKLGNSTRALSCFDSAIAKGERCTVYLRVPDSYYRSADERYREKDYAGALAYYTKAAHKYPAFQETPWGLFQIGNSHKALGHFKEAFVAYRELVDRFPEDYWAKQAQWKIDDTQWEESYRTSLH
jgi:tetratricopeptide (TPR) repeat protein